MRKRSCQDEGGSLPNWWRCRSRCLASCHPSSHLPSLRAVREGQTRAHMREGQRITKISARLNFSPFLTLSLLHCTQEATTACRMSSTDLALFGPLSSGPISFLDLHGRFSLSRSSLGQRMAERVASQERYIIKRLICEFLALPEDWGAQPGDALHVGLML